MKIAVALLLLMVVLAVVPGTGAGWFRKAWRGVTRAVGKVVHKAVDVVRKGKDFIRRHGKRDGLASDYLSTGMTDEEFMTALATRDVSELVDVNQMTDEELAEFANIQRDTRELIHEMDAVEDLD